MTFEHNRPGREMGQIIDPIADQVPLMLTTIVRKGCNKLRVICGGSDSGSVFGY